MTSISRVSIVRETAGSVLTDAGATTIPIELRYDSIDPLVAILLFKVPGKPSVEWSVARDLIFDGAYLGEVIGVGAADIVISREGGHISLELNTDKGHAVITGIPAEVVEEFVGASYAAFPLDAELADVQWESLLHGFDLS